jgi:hypothetical protein
MKRQGILAFGDFFTPYFQPQSCIGKSLNTTGVTNRRFYRANERTGQMNSHLSPVNLGFRGGITCLLLDALRLRLWADALV